MAASSEKFINEFRLIQLKCSRLYIRLLNETGLTQPQYAVLLELSHAPGKPVTMTELSRKLYITKPAVTSLVDRLERHGYIKRLSHPKDRRISLLEVQGKGKKVVERVQGKFLGVILRTFDQLPAAQRKIVESFYSELSLNVDQVLCGKKGCEL